MTYIGKVVASQFKADNSVSLPLTVPAGFFGLHDNSLGSGVYSPTQLATAACTLTNGKLSVNMLTNGKGYANGNLTQFWVAVIFTGGDYKTLPARGYPIINQSDGSITGVQLTRNGDYQTTPPTISFVIQGGGNIPPMPETIGAVRTHDFRGNGSSSQSKWYGIDPADGSGNYNWSILDQDILMAKALGAQTVWTLYGTPQNYAVYPSTINESYDNYAGGSSPLNAAGLVTGTANQGLWGCVTAGVTRYNVNAHQLINPLTGQNFPIGTRLLDIIEVSNEPQFGANGAAIGAVNGNYWVGSASQLVDYTRIINTAAKAVDPLIKIAGCGFISSFPMTYGTSQYNHFSNYLTAVDSVYGKKGIQWLDLVTIHPYDAVEQRSPFIRGVTVTVREQIMNARLTMQTINGSALPIIASEWGFYDPNSVFQGIANPQLQAIQIARVYTEHFLCGLQGSFGYSNDSIYLGNPTRNIYADQMLYNIGKNFYAGRQLTTAPLRGPNGAIILNWADGGQWFTG